MTTSVAIEENGTKVLTIKKVEERSKKYTWEVYAWIQSLEFKLKCQEKFSNRSSPSFATLTSAAELDFA